MTPPSSALYQGGDDRRRRSLWPRPGGPDPHQPKKVLAANLEIPTALPCRISLYEQGGKTRLATIKLTAMIALYPNPELKGVAEEVEATLEAIMTETAR